MWLTFLQKGHSWKSIIFFASEIPSSSDKSIIGICRRQGSGRDMEIPLPHCPQKINPEGLIFFSPTSFFPTPPLSLKKKGLCFLRLSTPPPLPTHTFFPFPPDPYDNPWMDRGKVYVHFGFGWVIWWTLVLKLKMANAVHLLHKLHNFGQIRSIKSGCEEHMDFGKPVVLPQCLSKSAHSPKNRKMMITLRLEYCV